MKNIKILILMLIVFSISAFFLNRSVLMQSHTISPNAGSDMVINFSTSQVTENVWFGTATGDASGDVTLQSLGSSPKIFRGTWAGRTRWQVSAGNDTFVAEMNGKINTYNGTLSMRGIVIEGANAGAEVSAQGQVNAINPHQFIGTIRVQP